MFSKHSIITGIALLFFIAAVSLWTHQGSRENMSEKRTNDGVEDLLDSTTPEDMAEIVGGSVADTSRYPYYCYLQIYAHNGDIMVCGGSLIHVDIVLTAAHCVVDDKKQAHRYIKAYCGVSGSFSPHSVSSSSAHVRNSEKLEVAGNFDYHTTDNDFAIFKLDSPINGLQTLSVNGDSSVPLNGADVTAIGFGDTTTGGSQPHELRKVDVEVVRPSDCSAHIPAFSNDIAICANEFGKGICQGDSGGPLIIPGANTASDVQIGITSFVYNGCADQSPITPDAYARVSAWYDKIVDFTCTYSSSPSTTSLCCKDDPVGWMDNYDDGCDWYAIGSRCETYGDGYIRDGKTANDACCACGGGVGGKDAAPADGCTDTAGWADSAGDRCSWYAPTGYCDKYGHRFANSAGVMANDACCVCGGGK